MGAHIMVRKKRMTRADIALLVEKASFCSAVCFVKETCFPDFEKKFGRGSLFLSNASLEDLPDSWIDFEGDVVFNNMSYTTMEDIEKILGFYPPQVDSEAHNEKRGRGGAIKLIRAGPVPKEVDPTEWMTAAELASRLPASAPALRDGEGEWVYRTFSTIAAAGFDCCILV